MTFEEFEAHCEMLATSECLDMLETIARIPFIQRSSMHTNVVDHWLDEGFKYANMKGAVAGTIKPERTRQVLDVDYINQQLEIENQRQE